MGLTIIHGAMHSGKSELLVKLWKECKSEKMAMLPQKIIDSGRDGIEIYNEGVVISRVVPVASYSEDDATKGMSFFIDEAQFMSVKERVKVLLLAYTKKCDVYLAMLEKDFLGVPFATFSVLAMQFSNERFPSSDFHVVAMCEECRENEATENKLFINGKMQENELKSGVFHIENDGEPCYKSMCYGCVKRIRGW